MIDTKLLKNEIEESNSIRTLMEKQSKSFNLVTNSKKERVYQWVDTDVSMISSRRLWDVLRLSKIKGCELDNDFIEEIKTELKIRCDYSEENPWRLPH